MSFLNILNRLPEGAPGGVSVAPSRNGGLRM